MSRKSREKGKGQRIGPEHYFSLCTGGLIKDIKGLAFTIEYLSDGEFRYHVNEERNDFSSWIRDVFGEDKLAEGLSKTKDRKDMQLALFKHLVNKK